MFASRKSKNAVDDSSENWVARKKERLDNTIVKLRNVRGLFENLNKEDQTTVKETEHDESCQDSIQAATRNLNDSDLVSNSENNSDKMDFSIIPKSKIVEFFYCMWENNCNSCWLDASMSLLSHNLTLRYETDLTCSSPITSIVKYYNEAICTLNSEKFGSLQERFDKAKTCLKVVQDTSLKYLQPLLKYNEGDPESAFCSLINLIGKEVAIRRIFDITIVKSFRCEKCACKKITSYKKPIITLPKVAAFQPSSPLVVSECPNCKAQEQITSISYKTLPKCLIFHFEGGAGKGEDLPLDFTLNDREYKVTGIITLEKAADESSVDHFVTWIREPNLNWWLECNDLNPNPLKFSSTHPQHIILEEVYIFMYEAFDDLGLIEVISTDLDEKSDLEDDRNNVGIPIIDLSSDDNNHCLLEKAGGLNTKDTSQPDDTSKKLSSLFQPDDQVPPSMPIITTKEPQINDEIPNSTEDTPTPTIENIISGLSKKDNAEEDNQNKLELNTAASQLNESQSEESASRFSQSPSNISDTSDKIPFQETIKKPTLLNNSCSKADLITNVNETQCIDSSKPSSFIDESSVQSNSSKEGKRLRKQHLTLNEILNETEAIVPSKSKTPAHSEIQTSSERILPTIIKIATLDDSEHDICNVNSTHDNDKVIVTERPPPPLEVNVKVNSIDSNDSESEELKEQNQIDKKILTNDSAGKKEFIIDSLNKEKSGCISKSVTTNNKTKVIAKKKSPRLSVKLPVDGQILAQENLKATQELSFLTSNDKFNKSNGKRKKHDSPIAQNRNLDKVNLAKSAKVLTTGSTENYDTLENLSSKYNLKPVSLMLNKLTEKDILKYTSKDSKPMFECASEDIVPKPNYLSEPSKLNFQSLDLDFQKYNEMQDFGSLNIYVDECFEAEEEIEEDPIEQLNLGKYFKSEMPDLPAEEFIKDAIEKDPLEFHSKTVKKRGRKAKTDKSLLDVNCSPEQKTSIVDDLKVSRASRMKGRKCESQKIEAHILLKNERKARENKFGGSVSEICKEKEIKYKVSSPLLNKSSHSSIVTQIENVDNNMSQNSNRDRKKQTIKVVRNKLPGVRPHKKELESNSNTRKIKRVQKSTSPTIKHQPSPYLNSPEHTTIKSKCNNSGTSLMLIEKTEEDKSSDCCKNPNIAETISSKQTPRKSGRIRKPTRLGISSDELPCSSKVNKSIDESECHEDDSLKTTKGHLPDCSLVTTEIDTLTIDQVVNVRFANKRKKSKSITFGNSEMSPSKPKRSPISSKNLKILNGISHIDEIPALDNKPQQNLSTDDQIVSVQCDNKIKRSKSIHFADPKMSPLISKRKPSLSIDSGIVKGVSPIVDQVVNVPCVNKGKRSKSRNFNDPKKSPTISKQLAFSSNNSGILKAISPGIENISVLDNKPQQSLDSIDDTTDQVFTMQSPGIKNISVLDNKPHQSHDSIDETINQVVSTYCITNRKKSSFSSGNSEIFDGVSPVIEKVSSKIKKIQVASQQNATSLPIPKSEIKSPAKKHTKSMNNLSVQINIGKSKNNILISAKETKNVKCAKSPRLNSFTYGDTKSSTSGKKSPISDTVSANMKKISSRMKKEKTDKKQVDDLVTSSNPVLQIMSPAKKHIESADNFPPGKKTMKIKEATTIPAISSTQTIRTSHDTIDQVVSTSLNVPSEVMAPMSPTNTDRIMVAMPPRVDPLAKKDSNVINADLASKTTNHTPEGECTPEEFLRDMDPIIQFIIDKTIFLYKVTDPK